MELNENQNLEPTDGVIPSEIPAEAPEDSGTPESVEGIETDKGEGTEEVAPVEEDVEEPKPKKDRVQERIDEITKQRREAEREAAYWKGRAEGLAPPAEAAAPKPAFDPMSPYSVPRPKEDDFETYGEFEVAKDDWLVSRAKHEAKIEAVKEIGQSRANAELGTWFQKAPANLSDFEEVVSRPVEDGGAPFTNEMVEIFRTSPVGHQLAYQLAETPKEVVRLRGLPPHLMAMEIARREAKLTVAPAPAKKISNAPTPIQPVTPAATITEKALEELPMEEFAKRRNRELYGPGWKG